MPVYWEQTVFTPIQSPHTDSKACLCSVISGVWSALCPSMIGSWFCTQLSSHRTAALCLYNINKSSVDSGCISFCSVTNENIQHSKVAGVDQVDSPFHPRVAVRKDFFLFLRNRCSLCKTALLFPLECLRHYVQSPQEEPYYSPLKAVRDPCSCSSQIPLRQT